MNQDCQITPINLSDSSQLDTLVEHRRIFNLKHCELNIFETFHRCDNVVLSYNGLVVSSMMRGKKLMSLDDTQEFDFLPGESVILPESISMKVDFPEADQKHPVQCATLALDWAIVDKNLAFLNEHYVNKETPYEWKLNFNQYHFINNKELAASLNKLISISMENDIAKDALADLGLKMLLLRIIQTQNLAVIHDPKIHYHRFTETVHYIKENLTGKISVDALAKISCMSKSAFYETFKSQFGLSPMEYVQQEKMLLAKRLMADHSMSITDVCYESGFNNLTYFTRLFKRKEGVTPSAYRK